MRNLNLLKFAKTKVYALFVFCLLSPDARSDACFAAFTEMNNRAFPVLATFKLLDKELKESETDPRHAKAIDLTPKNLRKWHTQLLELGTQTERFILSDILVNRNDTNYWSTTSNKFAYTLPEVKGADNPFWGGSDKALFSHFLFFNLSLVLQPRSVGLIFSTDNYGRTDTTFFYGWAKPIIYNVLNEKAHDATLEVTGFCLENRDIRIHPGESETEQNMINAFDFRDLVLNARSQ